MRAIDHHAWTNRWRDRHPAEKLIPALGLLGVVLVLPPLAAAPLALAVAVVATVFGAGVPLRALLGIMAAPALFLLAGAPFLAVSLEFAEGIALRCSPEGARLALAATLRALAAVSCLAFLTLTTPVVDWTPLLRRIKVPAGVIELILLVYRLIFVFAERASTGQRAQAARLGYARFDRSLRSLGLLAGNLFQRGLEQARRMEIGLTARGYTGELRVLRAAQPLSWARLALGLLGVGLVGMASGLLARALP
ncbi:MAG: cobalt ECF transporter T component CbiQ [Candidatus Competibacteraceae bacterium]|nr:cobalt ECF transporter T component CbiQ [Candidatus Competibacteraceae bacterium]MBK7983176.1 cobalt ECF transporter T component CbiQ [Candidatus Competibacteraceae bacterium]MBK8898276.1 cobalt ECF transporter T component CbiQ [Candidatus Competibacteraceae bacterium]MBK8962083.1 cobalt ECF transporter T component CbiQ [Candidatus Competibacteraceae bacterium]MBK9951295.1 cobalt ECF transporter T component CbiQ [Candidatus Competibacteraceae bacterium]